LPPGGSTAEGRRGLIDAKPDGAPAEIATADTGRVNLADVAGKDKDAG
jgi:hypothetical protein